MKRKKSKIPGNTIFARIGIFKKFLYVSLASIIAMFTMLAARIITIYNIKNEVNDNMEKSIITASEELINLSVESGVCVARSLYANKNIYEFLDREYQSAADYYDAYYKMQQVDYTAAAESNIIKDYMIYTSNETILSGGNYGQIDDIKSTGWYESYKKLDKTLIIYCDPETKEVSLIRKLDYERLRAGESVLKLDLNTVLLKGYFNKLSGENELYIISGGTMIYTSTPGISVHEISIGNNYQSFVKNYYSADVEYYTKVGNDSLNDIFIRYSSIIVVCIMVSFFIIMLARNFSRNINERIYSAMDSYEKDGSLHSIRLRPMGNDEIGKLIQMSVKLSDKLSDTSSEYEQSSESLREKNTSFHSMYTVAMRLDAQLYMQSNYPDLCYEKFEDFVLLKDEAEMLRKIAERQKDRKISVSVGEFPENVKVPSYSIALVGECLMKFDGNLSFTVKYEENAVHLCFESDSSQPSSRTLKLYAVFEENDVANDYDFRRSYMYNPFIRIKHFYGRFANIKIDRSHGFSVNMSIRL